MSDQEAGRRGVELLLREARQLHGEGRYADALRAADKAVEAAQALGDLGLEIKAKMEQAHDLHTLGDWGAALARYSWVLGVGSDPARRDDIEKAGVLREIATAYGSWVEAANALPEVPAHRLLAVLDAGESYVRSIGRPGWRASLLLHKACVLESLGRRDEAIGIAEEALSLRLRSGSAPGCSLATHRWSLGDMLRRVKRYEDARQHYQAILDDAVSSTHDRGAALSGLAKCALAAKDSASARKLAEGCVRLAERSGDDRLVNALEVLIRACLAAQDPEAARSAADRALAGARRLGSSHRLYIALRDSAAVAIAQKDAPRARALLDEAEPHAEAIDRSRGRTNLRDEIQRYRAHLVPSGTPT